MLLQKVQVELQIIQSIQKGVPKKFKKVFASFLEDFFSAETCNGNPGGIFRGISGKFRKTSSGVTLRTMVLLKSFLR